MQWYFFCDLNEECLLHHHSASIFQVIDKIEHAVNKTITEYYGKADKNKFTEAVDKAQQEVRESLDKDNCREKTKNYSSLAEKDWWISVSDTCSSEENEKNLSTPKRLLIHGSTTEPQDTRGN